MLAKSKKRDNIANSGEIFENDMEEYQYEGCSMNSSYNHETSFASPTENDNDSESGGHDHASHLTTKWSPPFTMKKNWNYRAVGKDGVHPRIKIRTKNNKVSKAKSKKSRGNNMNFTHDLSSQPDNNVLKTRLKLVSGGYSLSKKSKSRQKIKVGMSFGNNSLNGTNSANSDVDTNHYESNLVPNERNTYTETEINARMRGIGYNGGGAEAQYAQYLELKPSVKFKCCRCGINDFSTMAFLQEHMANCDGHSSISVTANSLPEHSTSVGESLQHSSVARNLKIKRKVLLCSSCGTYYQHYNLYIHMRETHNKQICLFCRNTFSRPQQLWDHLIAAHNLNSITYSTATHVRDAFKSFYITCCACNSVFSDQDKFDEHKCELDTNLSKNESYCSSCKPVNQQGLNSDVCNVTDESAVKPSGNNVHGDSAEDGENSDFAAFPEDESVSTISPLEVIGVPENHTVTSFVDEMETSQMSAAVNTQLDGPTFEHDSAEEEVRELEEFEHGDETTELPPVKDEIEEEIRSPIPSSSENIDEVAEDAPNEVENNGYDSNYPETSQDQNENMVASPCTENNIEPTLNEVSESAGDPSINDVSTKIKDKVSNWLDSDDENGNTQVQPQDEIEQNKPELSPQPLTMALMLDDTVASLSVQIVIKECVRTSCSTCLYCNNATVISVNGSQLASHLRSEHRFMPTKHEDSCEHVIEKLDEGIMDLKTVYMNASSTSSSIEFDGTFACLQCTFCTPVFKELCHHKRKLHHKVIFLCIMCKCNFVHYSQLLCHFCPGLYSTEVQHTLNYHCSFCNLDSIPSAFRLMVHLRKMHQACDICLARHKDQSELFSHMIKQHKMNHLCYKCNIAYRSRDGINEHLFWKHGTESVLCKRCLQKKWPHAYHFCIPASTYTCEECSRIFTKPVALTVHRRAHNGDFPSACTECDQRFISKRLLSSHRRDVHGIKPEPSEADAEKESIEQEPAEKVNAAENNEDSKKSRKRKRKKEKTDIEKPLLDELPPLNLSSESEEDSADEESVKPNAEPPVTPVEENSVPIPPEDIPVQQEPVAAVEDKNTDGVSETFEPLQPVSEESCVLSMIDNQKEDAVACDPIPSEELFPEVTLLERIKNCLVIEHSYCLPDSIFRSEGPDANQSANDNSFESAEQKLPSPKSTSKSRDKSGCKSVTPHKRKRPPKRDSSSSDSSSDSDTSSSSCGSNCSCNQKSNSNCSTSSSGSECSTTPDKRKSVKTSADEGRVVTNDEDELRREQYLLLNVRESDLDTDITTSDEDFYHEDPCLLPPVETRPELPTLPVPSIQVAPPIGPHITSRKESSRNRKNRKRRRAPKITINLGSHINRENNMNENFSINLQRVDTGVLSENNISSYRTFIPSERHPTVYPNNMTSIPTMPTSMPHSFFNNVPARTTASGDAKGRRSKRERTKNRFYGYSSSDEEASGNDSLKLVIGKKRPSAKRPSKSKLPFVGIRAKKPLIMPPKRPPPTTLAVPNSMATTHPSIPPHLYRMPSYIMQQQQQQYYSKTTSTNSSDDSDSDNLVINEPSLNERQVNNHPTYRVAMGPTDSSTSHFLQRPNAPHHSTGGPPLPVRSDVKLYCYCRCPYDEVSEMIGCDGKSCKIEWFHFECVGVMVPPKGQWYCPECRKSREGFSHLV